MSHYKSNLRDIEFNLFEVLGRDELLGAGPFGDVDTETVKEILREVDRLAREELATSFEEADRNRRPFDPETHEAPLPESFQEGLPRLDDAEYWRLMTMAELGGTPAPSSVCWALGELVLGANPAIWMYGAGPMFAGVVHRNGNERDKQIAQHIVDKGWNTTMVLTEPDAGSDVGAGRAKATPTTTAPGTSRASSASSPRRERPLREHHPPGAGAPVGRRGRGGPAPRACRCSSCRSTTSTRDRRADRRAQRRLRHQRRAQDGHQGLQHLRAHLRRPGSRRRRAGPGWLLGEVHNGIAQMFQVIENARMMVGTKAIATLSTGYLNALDFAKERVQGADLTQAADKTAPRVTITHHPDVRRSLMTQKAFAEAMRALVLYTASWQDR
jgi:alkylation response protein AidB-like acyl-CoA dehydrogenase